MRAVQNFTGVHDVVKIQRAGGLLLRKTLLIFDNDFFIASTIVKIWGP